MATNIVKWWKTRFLNGYKQFSVLMPTDSDRGLPSDTEELLSTISAPQSPPPAVAEQQLQSTPNKCDPCCCGASNTNSPLPKRELKFEEFECDVAVQGAEEPKEQDEKTTGANPEKCRKCAPPRQEFSFTLYDLDGHGKITKDDIAGLVTSIYDTLGATIQVPHTGSKTIRVRLTVAPENRKSPDGKRKNCNNNKNNNNKHEENLNNKESLYQNISTPNKQQDAQQIYSHVNFKSKNEVYYTNSSPNNTESVHYCSTKSPCSLRVCNNQSLDATKLYDTPKLRINESPNTTKKLSRERPPIALPKSCAPFSYSTPCSPIRVSTNSARVGISSPRISARKMASHNVSPARRRRTTTNHNTEIRERAYSGTLQRQELLSIIQTNMEKNLLALQHNNSTTHHRKRGDEGQLNNYSHHKHTSKVGGVTRRGLGKSHSTRIPSSKKTIRTTVDPTNNVISCSHYYLDLAGLESTNLCPKCDDGKKINKNHPHSRSKSHDTPHHLKHKTRELDHARAMAQVVEWLQGAQLGKIPLKSNAAVEDELDEDEDDDEVEETVERKTHRHIHEHVHHHYHHYTDSKLVI